MNPSICDAHAPPQYSRKRPWPFEEDGESGDNLRGRGPSISRDATHYGDPMDTELDIICFGSLFGVKAELSSLPEVHQSSYAGSLSPSLPVVPEGMFFALEFNDKKFGRLSKAMCGHLQQLTSKYQVQIMAYITDTDWETVQRNWNHQPGATRLDLELNICGGRADAREVGRILSKLGLFLQSPCHRPDGVEYHNPHILRIEGYPERSLTRTPNDESHEVSFQDQVRRGDGPTRANDTEEVDLILDSLEHHALLQEISSIPGINRPLLPHQKEAIDFVFRCETGQMPPASSLWRLKNTGKDNEFYQHVFSGEKRQERAEAKGGIIADEMGLGKSLVILSTIARSLDRAEAFVSTFESQQVPAQSRLKVASKATLIIAPSPLLIDNWVDEIRKHTHSTTLPFHLHTGKGRKKEKHLLMQRVIVFTTYATVANEFCRGDSTLNEINWFRIVLDEAHDIRNPKTKQFGAVTSLAAQHRWCLTGTPIHNRLEDLGALVTFLQVPIMNRPPTFRRFITNPITSGSRPSFKNLKVLLQAICIRRTRQLLCLPEPEPQLKRLPLTFDEKAAYHNLLEECRRQIEMVASGRRKNKVNSVMLESLLRLRIFCNNGSANVNPDIGPGDLPRESEMALASLQQLNLDLCSYCSGIIYSIRDVTTRGVANADVDGGMFIPKCWHLVCHTCIPHHHSRRQECPSCAAGDQSLSTRLGSLVSPQGQLRTDANFGSEPRPYPYPSKLLQLLTDICHDSMSKSIVFSCWTTTLKLVQQLFGHHRVRHYMIDGSKSLSERIRILNEFRSTGGANVLLMTLGTGAVGLNLAVASRVYVLEPQWNPFIESQAVGRALRLGQTAQVKIIKYIMRGTVEESKVLSRQKRKVALAGGGFSHEKETYHALLDMFGVNRAITSQ